MLQSLSPVKLTEKQRIQSKLLRTRLWTQPCCSSTAWMIWDQNWELYLIATTARSKYPLTLLNNWWVKTILIRPKKSQKRVIVCNKFWFQNRRPFVAKVFLLLSRFRTVETVSDCWDIKIGCAATSSKKLSCIRSAFTTYHKGTGKRKRFGFGNGNIASNNREKCL